MSQTKLRDVIARGARKGNVPMEIATAAGALNTEAAENFGNPKWHLEQAAVIGEAINLGFDNGPNFLAGVLQIQNVGLGDVVSIELRSGLEVFSVAEGGYVDESTVQNDVFVMGRDHFGWHIVETQEDALSDWASSLQDLVTLAKLKEQMEVFRRQYALLSTAVGVASPYYTTIGAALDKAELDAAITAVFDAPRYGQPLTLNSSIKLVGRASMVDKITDLAGYTPADEAKEEIRAAGYLGRYRGAEVVRLSNYVDEDNVSFWPENELWVVSPDAGRFVLYGGSRPNSWVDPAFREVHTDTRRTVGGLVHQPQVVRRLVLS